MGITRLVEMALIESDDETQLSRRELLTGSGAFLIVAGAWSDAADARPTRRERRQMAVKIQGFMRQYRVPGMSVAIGHRGHLAFADGYGFANVSARERVKPSSLFRIASLSKPITSVAIYRLAEMGRLRLNDRVFGRRGILGNKVKKIRDPRASSITVDQLLTHSAGVGSNNQYDPMFTHLQLSADDLTRRIMATRPLGFAPGRGHAYSNFGYCILGRVIEDVSGMPYDAFVRKYVLRPAGVRTMRIAGNRLADRARGEVVYYPQRDGSPYTMNVSRMDSHGGWIASAPDLVRLLNHVDGIGGARDILRRGSIAAMTRPGPRSPNYARGWSVNRQNNWWHTGALPGTTTIMVRTFHGFTWAALTNTRIPRSNMTGQLDRLMWDLVGTVRNWR